MKERKFTKLSSTSFSKMIFLLILFLSLGIVKVNAQLDNTFGIDGVVQTNIGEDERPISTLVLPNGKILVFLKSRDFMTTTNNYYFVRYNSDGSRDSSYGSNGIQGLNIPGILTKAVRQDDGKIIIVGWEGNTGIVARVDENGALDTSFSSNGIHRPNVDTSDNQFLVDKVYDVSITADGKILVGGIISAPQQSGNRIFFIKYFSDGSLDSSFNQNGYIINSAATSLTFEKMFIQSSGKILVFGLYQKIGNIGNLIKRFNADGTPDSSFGNILYSTSQFFSREALMLPDDSVIIAEETKTPATLERDNNNIKITKYSSEGFIDNTFGVNGLTSVDISTDFEDEVFALETQTDGQIIVGVLTWVEPNRTEINGPMLSLAKLSADGTLNGKFLVTRSFFSGKGLINILPDGKILTTFIRENNPTEIDLLLTRSLGIPFETYNFKGIPFNFGKLFGGVGTSAIDGKSDFAVFRPSDTRWYISPVIPPSPEFNYFGDAEDIVVASDYINDLGTDLAVFRPSNGTWYIAKEFRFAGQNFVSVQYGQEGDIPVPADFDNDSKSDIAVFRPSNGVWYIRNSNDNSNTVLQWGTDGDKPTTGDYDGDGKADIAVFRPSNGVWYVINSSTGQSTFTKFGLDGDIPVQEDYDGDGLTDIAVWRPSTRVWYILRSSDGGFDEVQFGLSDDYAVPADYDGDKKADIAVWRPSQGVWYFLRSSDLSVGLNAWGTDGDIIPHRRQ